MNIFIGMVLAFIASGLSYLGDLVRIPKIFKLVIHVIFPVYIVTMIYHGEIKEPVLYYYLITSLFIFSCSIDKINNKKENSINVSTSLTIGIIISLFISGISDVIISTGIPNCYIGLIRIIFPLIILNMYVKEYKNNYINDVTLCGYIIVDSMMQWIQMR